MKSHFTNLIGLILGTRVIAKIGVIVAVGVAGHAAVGTASAAPPPNDNFANAQLITSTVTFGTLQGAGCQPGENYHAFQKCNGSVWYKYVATGNGVINMDTIGSGFGTTLAVYQGTSISNRQEVVANDNFILTFSSRVSFGTVAGQTYYIAIAGDGTGGDGFDVRLNYSIANAVVNDSFANAITLVGPSGRLYSTTNVGASKEAGEPDHVGNTGGKSVWYKWTAPAGSARAYEFIANSYTANSAGTKQILFAVYKGSGVNSLTEVGRGDPNGRSRIVFVPTPGTVYYLAIDGANFGTGTHTISATLQFGPLKSGKMADFDGDGMADPAVFRPVTGIFFSQDSIDALYSWEPVLRDYQWGTNGDKPLLGDIDDDGLADYTVFRPDAGKWFIRRSATNTVSPFNWGVETDMPMYLERHTPTGNKMIPTVFRPSNGTWYSYLGPQYESTQWGTNGDIPVLADFNADGNDDLTVFRPSTGTWYILLDASTTNFKSVQFGMNGDKPVVADYDGDGKADIAVFRPSTGTWFILKSNNGQVVTTRWGQSGDRPQPADFNGDGKADIALFRNSVWWVLYTDGGDDYYLYFFGTGTDIPMTVPMS